MKYALVLLVLTFSFSAAASLCVAHRGGQNEFTENSLGAFEKAYQQGAQAIEMDIFHTKDDVGIILHNDTLESVAKSKLNRNCPLKTKVTKLRFSEIQNNCILKDGQIVPTLEDVFKNFAQRDVILLLEFKSAIKNSSLALIKEYYRDHPENLRLMSLNPLENLFLMIPKKVTSSFWKKIKVFSMTKNFHVGLATSYNGVDTHEIKEWQVKFLHKKHKEASVWTYDSKSEMEKYFKMNVDFLTTNDIELCLSVKNALR